MTVQDYIQRSSVLNKRVDEASDALHVAIAGRVGSVGLITKECRASLEYRAAHKEYGAAFSVLWSFNGSVPNEIKRAASELRRKQK